AIELSSWSALLINCADMCLLIGLSESAWLDAKQRLGDYAAAAILITTVEKALREPELIAAPGGYFCACVARAAEGKLALRKSLFGLRSLSIE
ncbi:replication initiation protein RepC, partial [Pseudovibrio ascidiaceicola]|uniref:replication initiation protein RepC n=1 Tax=Pseudovibrio ascidiaceicola TaxID=285279 RepID=UPI003D35B6B3